MKNSKKIDRLMVYAQSTAKQDVFLPQVKIMIFNLIGVHILPLRIGEIGGGGREWGVKF